MEFTGERLVLGKVDPELEIEHVNRYIFAKNILAGKKILDAACGSGYGTAMLASNNNKVVGIDLSEESINYAAENYLNKNVSFVVGSVAKLPFEDKSFDSVVSFETIEHVDGKTQNKFLKEIKRVLKQEGMLIISTPNNDVYKLKGENHFHVKEFTFPEFKEFLESNFKHVKLFSQQFEVCNVIVENKSGQANVENGFQFENAEYIVAVCSDVELPSIMDRVYIRNDGRYKSLLDWAVSNHNINEKNNKFISEKLKYIKELDDDNKARGEAILNLQNEVNQEREEIKENERAILSIKQELINKEEKLEALKQELTEKEEKLKALKQELTNKEEKLKALKQELIDKQEELEALKQELTEKEEKLKALKQELINKEGHIALLLESDRELERIKNSRSWKIISAMQKIVFAIIPRGSFRRLILKMVVKFIRFPLFIIKKLSIKRVKLFFYYLKREGVQSVSRRLDECLREPNLKTAKIKMNYADDEQFKTDITDFETIVFKKHTNPMVTIIIPVYNQFEYTYNCLKSIQQKSEDVSFEIVIANDCSTDLTTEINKFVKNITVVTNEQNLRFLKNCNNAAKVAKGKYILFLNNDTQVQPNWLKPLIELIEGDEKIGMVGSKLVYPDGRLQEAGGILWNDASAWNYGHFGDPNAPEYNYVKEVDYISGAAIMIKHSLWSEIGGFDERFAPAYYEDSDLAFEVRRLGYKVMYQPLSVVVHFEGISNGTDINAGQKVHQAVNQKKFYEKWKTVLKKEHFENGDNVFVAKDRSSNKKHILVVDHYVPMHDKDAGSKCTFMYINLFVSMGMKVTFMGDNFFNHEPYTTELNQIGVEVLHGTYYFNNWKKWIKENGKYFDYIYLNRAHIAIKYINFARNYSKAKIIYFNVDMQHVREHREYEITGDKVHLERAKAAEKIEMEISSKADVLHVVGSYEQNILKNIFPQKPVRNIPVYIYEKLKEDVSPPKERKDLLFVGGFSHQPNIDGVLWFNSEVFPNILDSIPSIKWHIVGSNVPENIKNLGNDHIICHGFVSDEELIELYNTCKVCIAPLRFGAGVKGKVIEAVYNRIPLVTTSIGSEGLSLNEGAFIVADEPETFAKMVKNLYLDDKSCEKLQGNCLEFIKNHFTVESAKKEILKDIII